MIASLTGTLTHVDGTASTSSRAILYELLVPAADVTD
jgi:hypothetical protein